MLQVQNEDGKKFLVMSETAYNSLTPEQISAIKKYNEIIYSNLETIEINGGGKRKMYALLRFSLPKEKSGK